MDRLLDSVEIAVPAEIPIHLFLTVQIDCTRGEAVGPKLFPVRSRTKGRISFLAEWKLPIVPFMNEPLTASSCRHLSPLCITFHALCLDTSFQSPNFPLFVNPFLCHKPCAPALFSCNVFPRWTSILLTCIGGSGGTVAYAECLLDAGAAILLTTPFNPSINTFRMLSTMTTVAVVSVPSSPAPSIPPRLQPDSSSLMFESIPQGSPLVRQLRFHLRMRRKIQYTTKGTASRVIEIRKA